MYTRVVKSLCVVATLTETTGARCSSSSGRGLAGARGVAGGAGLEAAEVATLVVELVAKPARLWLDLCGDMATLGVDLVALCGGLVALAAGSARLLVLAWSPWDVDASRLMSPDSCAGLLNKKSSSSSRLTPQNLMSLAR